MANRHREEAWNALLDVERLSRYYGHLSAGLLLRQRALDVFMPFGSIGVVGSVLLSTPPWASAAAAGAVVLAATWSLAARYGETGASFAPMSEELDRIAGRHRQLWAEIEALGDDEARGRLEALCAETDRCMSGAARHRERRPLNRRCAEEAYAMAIAQFGPAADQWRTATP